MKNIYVNTGISQIKSSSCERLLGIDRDFELSFGNYINQVCAKSRINIKALARIAPFLNKGKRKLPRNTFSNHSLVIAHYHGFFIAVH